MTAPLIVLHGFTQNGAQIRHALGTFLEGLGVQAVYPDAPHDCSEESVARLYSYLGTPRAAAPHRYWWDATDDGRIYRGWDESRAQLATVLAQHPGAGVLGFSQGASVAAALAALAAHGDVPPLRFVVMVAGRIPRAEVFDGLFDAKIAIPSLHVWGERDVIAATSAPALSKAFDPTTRQAVSWDGPHVVPTRGPGADAIAAFLEAHRG